VEVDKVLNLRRLLLYLSMKQPGGWVGDCRTSAVV